MEKIVRIQEKALSLNVPIVYLVDSAGGRITDQVEMFPGRRHAGRIFYNQVKCRAGCRKCASCSGLRRRARRTCRLCRTWSSWWTRNASAYLGSPRMAEMVIGEKVDHEAMGGARMHCTVSGLGDVLAPTEEDAIASAKAYLAYMPANWRERPAAH